MTGSRRPWTLMLLGLLALGYGFIAVGGQIGTLYPSVMPDQPLSGTRALLAAGVPALIGLALFVAVRRQMPITWVAVLFGAWFVIAVLEAIVFAVRWGAVIVINGAIPLLVVWPDLRRGLSGGVVDS